MPYDPNRHHRRSIRLKGYDYTQPGAYFVTIVTQHRECLFGEIVNSQMVFNEAGRMIKTVWDAIPQHHPGIETDAFVIMPNHIHGIIVITAANASASVSISVGAGLVPAPTTTVGRRSLGNYGNAIITNTSSATNAPLTASGNTSFPTPCAGRWIMRIPSALATMDSTSGWNAT